MYYVMNTNIFCLFYIQIFTYVVSRGQRQITEDLNLDVTVFGHSATQKDLEIELNEFEPTIIVKCEVEGIRDNGYGQRTHLNKDGQVCLCICVKRTP